MYQVPDVINTPLSETLMVRIILHLAQTSYRARCSPSTTCSVRQLKRMPHSRASG